MRRLVLLVAWLCVMIATPAYAQTGDKEGAAALKKLGDQAMDSLRYDDALKFYGEAYALYPDPAILYNRGRVYGARGEYPLALADLERFDREAPADLKAKVPLLAQLLAEVSSHVATVKVTCDQPGARVLVRQTLAGTTPITEPLKLNAGNAAIEVTKDGFQPYKDERTLEGGKTVELTIALVPVDMKGTLALKSTAGAATVSVDGVSAGTTPLETRLEPGTHRLLLRADGYDDTQTSAVIRTGERRELEVEMHKKPGILARWWFWTGVGAVVVGGVILTYALLTEKPASSGDNFAPAQVTGPLRF